MTARKWKSARCVPPPSFSSRRMFTAMQRDLDFRDFVTFEELRQWCMQMTGGSMAMFYRVTGAAAEPVDGSPTRQAGAPEFLFQEESVAG
ncbi:squalene/phytoene synthase family protein [Streptomyces spirodelae]|uniref:squalene/phytoene synthase family protein n=1 Tax=Streptomyces spirodelae TaxID=2812904 RepID=UPI001E37AC7D|nr:squalene/phytoene synthase family protein [Streptomyces spirodelae]